MENKAETLKENQKRELAQAFRGNQSDAAVKNVKSFLSNNEVKTIANNDLRQALLLKGIDENFIIEERKDILKQSKANKQFSASLKALEGLEQHLGLNTKIKITETRQANSNLQDNYDNAVKQSKKVTIEQQVTPQDTGQNDTRPGDSEKTE